MEHTWTEVTRHSDKDGPHTIVYQHQNGGLVEVHRDGSLQFKTMPGWFTFSSAIDCLKILREVAAKGFN